MRYIKVVFCMCICFTLLAGSYSCKKIDQFSQIEVPFSRSFPVESTTLFDLPIDVTSPSIDPSENIISQNVDLESERLESITLKSMKLIIDSTSEMTFSYLESIELFLVADGLEEEKVAWTDDIADDIGQLLELETSNSDITPYLTAESLSFRLKASTDEAIAEDHEVEVASIFIFDLKILGQ